jgi:hypothetical protein
MAAGGRCTPAAWEAPRLRPTAAAEAAADEVVRRVRPTEASERRRAEVVDYARSLVGAALGCEVRPVLSSPLAVLLLFVRFSSPLSASGLGVFVGRVGQFVVDVAWPDSTIDFLVVSYASDPGTSRDSRCCCFFPTICNSNFFAGYSLAVSFWPQFLYLLGFDRFPWI